MKISYQYLDGRQESKTFADPAEFVMLQNREIPAIEDAAKVLKVEIDGKEVAFEGNIADLFFKYNA